VLTFYFEHCLYAPCYLSVLGTRQSESPWTLLHNSNSCAYIAVLLCKTFRSATEYISGLQQLCMSPDTFLLPVSRVAWCLCLDGLLDLASETPVALFSCQCVAPDGPSGLSGFVSASPWVGLQRVRTKVTNAQASADMQRHTGT
jgi:hypothetical protein